MKSLYDIAIIGGGPAGTACALALVNSGLKVILIDKSTFPRDKICGDAIPGPAFKLMDKLNPTWGIALRSFTKRSEIKFSKGFSPNGKSFTVGWQTFSFNSKRENFDNFLYELVKKETDTEIVLNQQLTKITRLKDGVLCKFKNGDELHAKMIIGCDGGRSLVSKTLATHDIKKEAPFVAMRAYYKNVKDVKSDTNEFHFFKGIMPGYFWIFPLGNNWVNVGFGMLTKTTDADAPNMKSTLEDIINELPSIAPRFANAECMDSIKGCALPISTKGRVLSGERFILCGDAASLINPIGGHGIDTAMWSGYYAAEQALKCFKSNNFSSQFISDYDAIINRKFKKGFKRNYGRVRFLMRFPWLINSIFNNGKLIKRLMDI